MIDGLGLSGLSLYGRKNSRKRLGKGFSTLGRTFGKSDELLEKLLRSDELSEKLWKNFYGRTNFRKSLRKGWEEVWRLRTASEKVEKSFSDEERLRIIIGKGIARGRARGAVACATRRPEKSLQERRAAPEQTMLTGQVVRSLKSFAGLSIDGVSRSDGVGLSINGVSRVVAWGCSDSRNYLTRGAQGCGENEGCAVHVTAGAVGWSQWPVRTAGLVTRHPGRAGRTRGALRRGTDR